MASGIVVVFLINIFFFSYGFEIDIENNSIVPHSEGDGELVRPMFRCGEDGVSPSPISCESYIRCSHHLKYVVPCPGGLHFRNETGQCENPCDAHCDQKLACECGWSTCSFKCEEPNGLYRHPDDCEKYMKCYDGKASVRACPRGQAFNDKRKKCVSWAESGCI